MTYISLFAGIGGFDLALDRLGHHGVYANDHDKYCKIIYDKHFRLPLDGRDIRAVALEDLPNHDLLVGGFPCQAFSVAGDRLGFADARGTLFFALARVLAGRRPPLFLLENVRGLLSHDHGRTFKVILRTLDDLGYDLQWQVCNSKDFGVPQNRERVYIIGHLRSTPRPQVFPLLGTSGQAAQTDSTLTISRGFEGRTTVWRGLSTALRNFGSGGNKMPMVATKIRYMNDVQNIEQVGQDNRVFSDQGIAPPLSASGSIGRLGISAYPGHTVNEAAGIAHALKAGVHGVPGGEGLVHQGLVVRRLTPLECERLQGFPDQWTAGVSDTQRYKMLGNAVTVNVVETIGRRL
jgi:DNA (cytosine-5)-methyltransferase 1